MAYDASSKRFRKGHPLVEFTRIFPDDAAAERWFAKVCRWDGGNVDLRFIPACAGNAGADLAPEGEDILVGSGHADGIVTA